MVLHNICDNYYTIIQRFSHYNQTKCLHIGCDNGLLTKSIITMLPNIIMYAIDGFQIKPKELFNNLPEYYQTKINYMALEPTSVSTPVILNSMFDFILDTTPYDFSKKIIIVRNFIEYLNDNGVIILDNIPISQAHKLIKEIKIFKTFFNIQISFYDTRFLNYLELKNKYNNDNEDENNQTIRILIEKFE